MKCDEELCILIEADIFYNKSMQANIPKPLRNLGTYFNVNMLMPIATDFGSAKSLTMCKWKALCMYNVALCQNKCLHSHHYHQGGSKQKLEWLR